MVYENEAEMEEIDRMLHEQGITEEEVEDDLNELEAMLAQEEIGGAEVPSEPIQVQAEESKSKDKREVVLS